MNSCISFDVIINTPIVSSIAHTYSQELGPDYIKVLATPLLRQFVGNLSPWRPRFSFRPIPIRFVVTSGTETDFL